MRLPLGQAYRGRCHAAATGESPLPLKICNQGYARGRCNHFPASHEVDANRFAKLADGGIVWIEEAAHAPLRFGPAREIPEGSVAMRQLEAFQKSDAEGRIR